MLKQQEVEALVLHALYGHYQLRSEKLDLNEVTALLGTGVTSGRVEMALETLRFNGYVETTRVIFAGQRIEYWLSEEGYKYAEELTDRASESSTNPLSTIEAQLAPAAGRLVSFKDNQDSLDQTIAAVDDAVATIRSSNVLDPQERDDAVLSIVTWRDLAAKARTFAVGAFNFLVWDRIKSIIESGIEDAYRVGLTAILITLGTLILSLF